MPATSSKWATNAIAGASVAPASDPPGHDGAEPVGADREPGTNASARALGVSHHRAGHGAAVVEQLLDRGALEHLGARLPARPRASPWSSMRRDTESPVGRNGGGPASAKRPWSRLRGPR